LHGINPNVGRHCASRSAPGLRAPISQSALAVLNLHRIDDFEKRKTVKVSIASADLPDAMLTHEDRRVRVVQEIACEVRNFSENLLRDDGMSLCRKQ
jgi:hypothetical protein